MRLASDLLMVNPNRGFTWHQDNQNGPVAFDDALRWWVTMDDTPPDYGEREKANKLSHVHPFATKTGAYGLRLVGVGC